MDFPKNAIKKKRKKWPYVLLAIAGVVILLLGLIGILPGTNRPRNLNVKYTNDDYLSAKKKIEPSLNNLGEILSNINLDDRGNLNYNLTLSEAEISALINEEESPMPLRDVQIKINSDGSIETSGMMDFRSVQLPVYGKIKGEIISGKADFSIDDLRVGSIPMPTFIRDRVIDALNSSINDRIKNDLGIGPSEVTFSDGEMHLNVSRN